MSDTIPTSDVPPRHEQIAQSVEATFGSLGEEALFHVIQEKKRVIEFIRQATLEPNATEVLEISLETLQDLHEQKVRDLMTTLTALSVPELVDKLDDALMADAVNRQRVEDLVAKGPPGPLDIDEYGYRQVLQVRKDEAFHGFHAVAWIVQVLKLKTTLAEAVIHVGEDPAS